MFDLSPWHLWVIAAVVLLIAEVFTPGFVLACFGVGALLSGLAAAAGLSFNAQVGLFAVVSLAVFFGLRPFYLKHVANKGPDLKTNTEALVGRRGLVVEAIAPLHSRGRVKVGGEDWSAVTADESELEAGAEVQVVRVEGSRVVVQRQG